MSFLSPEEQEYFARMKREIQSFDSYKRKWYERRADETLEEYNQRSYLVKQAEMDAQRGERQKRKIAEEVKRQREARESKPALNWDNF